MQNARKSNHASLKSNVILWIIFLAIAIQPPTVIAQPAGRFTATGNMITPRSVHTATLLPNGKVLMTGGAIASGGPSTVAELVASSELYDPATGTFAATGNMSRPRAGYTATLLPDGKVLIAGGYDAGTFLASAELYDAATGEFSAIGAMTTPRSGHTATLLGNGQVLIAGGASNGHYLVSAELYDPWAKTFTDTGNMTEPFSDTATLLANGKVLITRSVVFAPVEGFVGRTELYDPSTGTFAATGDTAVHHTLPTVTLLTNGKVLVTGGDIGDGDGAINSAELYDPVTGTFAATSDMTAPREGHTATSLPDSTVLIAGYYWRSYGLFPSAELYDLATGTFSSTGEMLMPRSGHTATLLADGTVLMSGGNASGGNVALASAELYHPAVLVPAAALLSLSGDGRGQGAILHADTHQIASADNPVVAGEVLEIYCTRLIDRSIIPPQVAIGGRMAEVLWFGKAPGFAGLNQINVRVPSGVVPGVAVSVRLNYLGRPSNEVSIGVR